MFQQMTYIDAYIKFISVTCSPHNAKTTIDQYRRTNRLIPIISKTADNRLIQIMGRLLVHLYFVLTTWDTGRRFHVIITCAILADIRTKCSDMDHSVLPANYTMSAFPS